MKAAIIVICLTVLAACTSPTRTDPVFKNLHKHINKGATDA